MPFEVYLYEQVIAPARVTLSSLCTLGEEQCRLQGVSIPAGGDGRTPVVSSSFLIEAASALLKFARSTSDPNVAAALLDKAAELNERIATGTVSTSDTSPNAPDVATYQSA
ncbi:hypothetical protein J6524_11455 [Bradyrhizobium sp. WSM 1738]|uniref:hypothetical protein n=1 Tax=Bradyrhizobium hereditatis TaxID=2821405 RepID=UPI001CE2C607|nr:hypothetical protein [Bradyrhizobium hereditatis]MCA6115504.1 hypothetical protein [Bradyrhizobium hereditatis]